MTSEYATGPFGDTPIWDLIDGRAYGDPEFLTPADLEAIARKARFENEILNTLMAHNGGRLHTAVLEPVYTTAGMDTAALEKAFAEWHAADDDGKQWFMNTHIDRGERRK